MKDKIISGIRKAVIGGLVALASMAGGCGSSGKFFDKQSVYAETKFVSDFVFPMGGVIKGPQRQDLVVVSPNNRLSCFMWENYSAKEKEVNERDFGLSYSVPIANNVSASIGVQYWDYPTGVFGNHDIALNAGIKYNGLFDLGAEVVEVVAHDNVEEGRLVKLSAGKTFSLYEDKKNSFGISLTPKINTSITQNYFGGSEVFGQITPGVDLDLTKKVGSVDVGLKFFLREQIGRGEDKETFPWSGMGLSVKW